MRSYPRRMSDSEHRACLRRAVIASTVGTTIEWYDFLLYSVVTGLVFGKLYFPSADPLVSTLQAFGVFFIGFAARPIGAVVFGHYGDRIGRKATLIVTLLITGIATAAVGLVPGYDTIGIWGGIILTVLRVVQGIGVGGEWGGSVLLAMEWARDQQESRLYRLVATTRCAGGDIPRQRSSTVLQLAVGRSVSELGLANSVSSQHCHGWGGALDPSWHHRDSGVPAHPCRE